MSSCFYKGEIQLNKGDPFAFQVLHLTKAFYQAYPNPPCAEILKKEQRSYNCLLVQSHYGYFICIPYRSEIKHHYSYLFKNSHRSNLHKSGLDYTKIVIIVNSSFISAQSSLIDQDEYVETRKNIRKIKDEALAFVDDYVNHIKGITVLHLKEFARRYQYSPLKYFHKELGITQIS